MSPSVEPGKNAPPWKNLYKAGGWAGFIENAPPEFFRFTADKYNWTYMLVFFLMLFFNLSTSWSMVQRYYSTRSEKDARKVGYFVSVLLTLGPPLFFLPAMAARTLPPSSTQPPSIRPWPCRAGPIRWVTRTTCC